MSYICAQPPLFIILAPPHPPKGDVVVSGFPYFSDANRGDVLIVKHEYATMHMII